MSKSPVDDSCDKEPLPAATSLNDVICDVYVAVKFATQWYKTKDSCDEVFFFIVGRTICIFTLAYSRGQMSSISRDIGRVIL